MRVASFSITKEGLPAADLSVIPLEGTGGGLLLNVGQWRQQLGLNEIAEEAIASFRRRDRCRGESLQDGGFGKRGCPLRGQI